MAVISVLLGAGASVDAGIPTSVELTDSVIGRVDDVEEHRMLEFVRHTLAASLAEGRGPAASPGDLSVAVDVETLFAAVELLANRDRQPWAPFIAAWHPGLERFAPPERSDWRVTNDLEHAINRMLDSPLGARNLASAIVKALGRESELALVLERTRTSMLRSLFSILSIDGPSQVRYLDPLVQLLTAQDSLTVATLNYDRSIENLADAHGLSCDTGIETWLASGALDWQQQGVRLLKLHGSIDWVVEGESHTNALPMQRIRKVTDPNEKQRYDAPAIVFGDVGKLRAEGPFLELLLAWASHLKTTDCLIVCGYSFRDPHVNEIIARWFNERSDRRVVVLDTSDFLNNQPRDGFAWHLERANRDSRGVPLANARIEQVLATTAEGLDEAITKALAVDPTLTLHGDGSS